MNDGQHRLTKPDLVVLLAASYRVLIDRLLKAHVEARLGAVRPTYGFVIRAVAAERPSIKRLAALLDTSKQAASKLVDTMVRKGLLERFTDPDDRRVIRLTLAPKGERVRQNALATSRALERELSRRVGAKGVVALKRALVALLEQNGARDEVRSSRARPVW